MNDIRPLKDVVDIAGAFPVIPAVIFILILLAIAAFIHFRKKRGTVAKPVAPPRPAEEIAIEALKALVEMRLIEKGLIKEYYIRLSDIMRAYIESRYEIFALDRTTRELFQEMRSKRTERLHADKINSLLEDCDMVKFAKYVPDQKEIERIHKKAEEIVNITTPKITT
ncbi:MAG: hypothetical protein Q7O04_05050 [Candidatus Omnitrophota bacterium]|nr:hypothetical protein [Candidatus Omnitrophota bacterium]